MGTNRPVLSKTGWIIALATMMISLTALPPSMRPLVTAVFGLGPINPTGEVRLLAYVRDGQLTSLGQTMLGRPVRASRIDAQEARSPESAELDLQAHEGQFVLLKGFDHGGWLYSARVERALKPIEVAIVRWTWPEVPGSEAPGSEVPGSEAPGPEAPGAETLKPDSP